MGHVDDLVKGSGENALDLGDVHILDRCRGPLDNLLRRNTSGCTDVHEHGLDSGA